MSKSIAVTVSTAALLAIAGCVPADAQSLIPAWSGPYWGVDAGAAWANAKNVRHAADVAWGAHAGYGLQLGLLYLGAEVDGTWGGARATSEISPLISSTLEVDWTASARARLGLAFGDALVYATGGAAWSGQTTTINSFGSQLAHDNAIVSGAVWGGGIEVKPIPFVAARIEALRYDFSSDASNLIKSLPTGVSSSALKGLSGDETVVRAGISLRFN